MRYALYEHPRTHKFAFLQVPSHFAEGDRLPSDAIENWFETREAAVAAVPELLNQPEGDDGALTVPADRSVAMA